MLALKMIYLTFAVMIAFPAACLPPIAVGNLTTEQIEASQLLLDVRSAATSEMEKYRSDPKFDKDLLHEAEIQMARIRVIVDCKDGVASIRERSEIRAFTIASFFKDGRQTADRDCRVALAKLAAERSDDPSFNAQRNLALQYQIGAELSALGDPSGVSFMKQAEQTLTAQQEFGALAEARLELVELYVDPKDRKRFLEESVPVLKKVAYSNSTKNGFLVFFAQSGRCDLVEAVNGVGSCPKFEQILKELDKPIESQKFLKVVEQWRSDFRLEQISTDRDGLKLALARPYSLFHLARLAQQARNVVTGR